MRSDLATATPILDAFKKSMISSCDSNEWAVRSKRRTIVGSTVICAVPMVSRKLSAYSLSRDPGSSLALGQHANVWTGWISEPKDSMGPEGRTAEQWMYASRTSIILLGASAGL